MSVCAVVFHIVAACLIAACLLACLPAYLLQVAACMGKEGDATPFTSVTVDNISAALHRCAPLLSRPTCRAGLPGWPAGLSLPAGRLHACREIMPPSPTAT